MPRCAPTRARAAPRNRRTPGRASAGSRPCRCVRPILTMSAKASAFADSVDSSAVSAGSRLPVTASAAATFIAVGKTSFDDCPRLTSSLGCTSRPSPRAPAEDLGGAIGEHLVDVHVGLRARSGLPDGERKFTGETSREPFVRRGHDRVRRLLRQRAQRRVDARRRSLDDQERPDQRLRHLLRGDAEMLERALRLRAPEPIGRDFDRSERVVLDACGMFGHANARPGP